MIEIPSLLQAKLDAGVTTLCTVWRITRIDGQVFGFTDHDRAVELLGLECIPHSGLEAGESHVGLQSGAARTAVFGAIDSNVLIDSELDNGVWDQAKIEVFQLDWSEPELYFQTLTGTFGAVTRQGASFEVDVSAPSVQLNRTIGRVFSKLCDAELGDSRCGVSLEQAERTVETTIGRLISPSAMVCVGAEGMPSQWFKHGILSWTSGRNAGAKHRITDHQSVGGEAIIEIDSVPAEPITLSDQATLLVGCDKQFSTCRSKFSNQARFRGCPHMPGNDVLLRAASAEQIKDGSAR